MKPLLLLIDLQNDYLATPALEPSAGALVRQASRLLREFRERGLAVAHVWTTIRRHDDCRMPHWKQVGRWQCEEGTTGHLPPLALQPRDGERVIHKNGFTPDLRKVLMETGADSVVLAGVHLHACVRQTAIQAYEMGITVGIVEDAVGSNDPIHACLTRSYLEARGVRFLPVRGLATWLDDPAAASGRVDAARDAVIRAEEYLTLGKTAESWAGPVERLARALEAESQNLGDLMAREFGKPVRFGRVEAVRTAEKVRAVLARARSQSGAAPASQHCVRRRPHGVVAVITPFNNPIYLSLGKVVPAVLYGNAVVWKPAPEANGLSRRLLEILAEADWPEGAVNRVEGGRYEAETLMNDRAVAAVTLTGSSAAGAAAQTVCTLRRIPLQAELGGNNAAVVWEDADLVLAARTVAAGAFEMAGQRCTANRRVIVPVEICETFIDLLREETAAIRWGDPLDPETRIGPLAGPGHRDRVAGVVERAADLGAAIFPQRLAPANVRGHAGAWFPPTIIRCANPEHEIVQEETFGPVLVVQPARDWDHALALCNGVRQGLAAAVFTCSPEVVARFLDTAQAGILKINQSTADAAVDVPFGGWKASGVGLPEHGPFDLEFYTRPQTVYRCSPPIKGAC